MRSKILYLITSIFLLVIFTQCEDSLTITANQPEEEEELPTPELVSPTNNSTNQSIQVELNWKRIKGAKEYKIQLSKSEGFESAIVDSMIEGSSYTTPDLETGTTYFWRVKPFKRNYEGPWSEVWQFTTSSGEVEPVTVELISPEQDTVLNTDSPTFNWSSVSEAADYHYQLSKDADFNDLVKDSVIEVSDLELVLSGSGSTYYWRVSPIVDSAPSEWSEIYNFTKKETSTDSTNDSTNLTAPVLLSPEDGGTEVDLQPTIEWQSVEGADYYILHANRLDPGVMVIETEVEGTSFTPETDLDSETVHDWRVRAVSDDIEGEWSEIHRFTTGSGSGSDDTENTTVSLVSPSDGAGSQSTSLSLDWESVSAINEYQVQLATDNSFSSPVVDEAVSQTSYGVSNLDYSQTYYWRVQANGDGNSGNWSTVYSFTTKSDSNNDSNNGDYKNSVEGDRQALLDLYEATGGSGWSNNSGWGSGNPDNSWYGVEVDANGRVVRLDLYKNGLQGRLPESIGNLTKLSYLNTKGNRLTGTIPSSIGNMEAMEWLILAGRTYDQTNQVMKEPPKDLTRPYHPGKRNSATNDFSGAVPSTIGNLKNLKRLEISGQSITSIPDEIGNITALEGIYINLNYELTGQPFPNVTGLTELRHLYLAGNEMEGTLPRGLSNLTKLTFLHLGELADGENHFTGSLPDFSSHTNLRSIVFDANDLSGEWPHYWNNGNFTKLNTLRASWNEFTGTLHGFENLPGMRSFSLVGNNMSGDLSNLTSISGGVIIISLGWNDFTGELPQTGWPDFSQLRLVRFNNNNLSGHIPGSFFEAADNPYLKWLYLQNNEFTSVDRTAMNNISSSSLQEINISGNNF